MPMQTLTAKPARQGQAQHVKRPTKLQIACQKAFGASKSPISGIKGACSPIDTCVSSYEINSVDGLIATPVKSIYEASRLRRNLSHQLFNG